MANRKFEVSIVKTDGNGPMAGNRSWKAGGGSGVRIDHWEIVEGERNELPKISHNLSWDFVVN